MSNPNSSSRLNVPKWPLIILAALIVAIVIALALWCFVRPPDSEAQVLGGAALLGGLYFTWVNAKTSQSSLEVTKQSAIDARLSEDQRRQDEQYFHALAALGDDNVDGHIAGLLMLERVYQERPELYWTIIELICAFIRRRSEEELERGRLVAKAPTDIAIAFELLCRRKHCLGDGEDRPLNLRGALIADLRLEDGDFQDTDFSGCVANDTWFIRCNLNGCRFEGALLRRAFFDNTVLQWTLFYSAEMQNAHITFLDDIPPAQLLTAEEENLGTESTPNMVYRRPNTKPVLGQVPHPDNYLSWSAWEWAQVNELQIDALDLTLLQQIYEVQFDSMFVNENALRPLFSDPPEGYRVEP
jgi:hypothetical protein